MQVRIRTTILSLCLTGQCFLPPHALGGGKEGYFSLNYNRPSLNIEVDNQGAEVDNSVVPVESVQMVPLSSTNAGFTLSLEGYTIGYSRAVENKDEAAALQPEFTDYRLTYFGKRFGIDGTYSQFKHFRLNRGSGVDLTQFSEEQKRRNIHLATASVNVYASLTQKTFALEDYFDISARQKKSLGGWLLINSLDWAALKSPDGLVPLEIRDNFGNDGSMSEAKFKAYNLQLAYAHVFSWGDFYLSGLLSLGAGRQWKEIVTDAGVLEGEGHVAKAGFRFALAYSAKNWFTGYEIQAEGPTYLLDTVRIITTRVNGQFFIGWRF